MSSLNCIVISMVGLFLIFTMKTWKDQINLIEIEIETTCKSRSCLEIACFEYWDEKISPDLEIKIWYNFIKLICQFRSVSYLEWCLCDMKVNVSPYQLQPFGMALIYFSHHNTKDGFNHLINLESNHLLNAFDRTRMAALLSRQAFPFRPDRRVTF